MKSWVSTISLAALLPLAAADCDNFDFTGQFGSNGFSATYNTTFQVSGWKNCTADVAAQDNRNGSCSLDRGIGIGLEVYPEVRYVQVDRDSQREILALVQEKMSAAAAATTNFNSTIVMNYTSVLDSISVGDAGYNGYTPNLNCFDGVLSDCDDDDSLEGKAIRVCGLKWLDRSQGFKSQGQQLYDGVEHFVSSTGNGTGSTSPLQSYDQVSGDATNYLGDDDDDHGNSAARNAFGSAALVIALLSSVYEIM